jgi:hypothetical protein
VSDQPMPMRTREETVRAHDLLVQLLLDDELRGMIEPAVLERIQWHADVLCWMLHHDHNQNFAINLAALETSLAGLGFELTYCADPEAEASPS